MPSGLMKVKELTIQGFKSFVDRTLIPLHPGITVVVGPNGCGKSNVLDALRWVMGEQRPSQLRGKAMADVIFNGTHTLKPAGMAEVNLTMVADEEPLPEPYDQYSELQISRRMYRHGESEYFLGKVPCRLKDITALFRDTGIGAKGYAFIEQGRVSQIITAKPKEIRVMFEEAAGISGFQVQRQESYRKISDSEANLERLHDIIKEVNRNLRQRRQQARQAKKFTRLQEEERQLDQQIAGQRYRELTAALEPRRREVATRKERLAAREQRLTRLHDELEQLQRQLRELQEQIDAGRRRLNANREKVITTTSRVELRRQELAALEQQLQAAENRRRGLGRRREELRLSRERLEGELEQAAALCQQEEKALQALAAAYEQAKTAVAAAAGQEDRLREQLFVSLRQETRLNNDELMGQEKRQRLAQRRQELQARSREDAERHQALQEKIAAAAAGLDDCLQRRERLTAAIRQRQEEEAAVQARRQDLESRCRESLARFTGLEREWHLLHTKVVEGFGFSAGMKQVLREEGEQFPIGSFWDVFQEVPAEWEAALELFIRQLCEGVVITDQQVVPEFIDRQRRRPRVAVLHPRRNPLLIDGRPFSPAEIPCLAELVQVKEKFRQVVEPVLRRTYVAADGDTARRLLPELPDNAYILTADGEIYAGNGWFWVGKPQQQESLDLLSLRRQLEETSRRRQAAQKEVAAREAELAAVEQELAVVREVHQQEREQLAAVEDEERQQRRLLDDLQQSLSRAAGRREQAAAEERQLQEQERELQARLEAVRRQLAEIAAVKDEQERQLAALAAGHREAREKLLQHQEKLAEKKVALAAAAADKTRQERELQRLQEEEERLRRQQETLEREVGVNRRQQEEQQEAITSGTAEIDRLVAAGRREEEQLAGWEEEKRRLDERQRQQQEAARLLEKELAVERPELVTEQLDLQQLESSLVQLENGFRQRYGLSLAAYLDSPAGRESQALPSLAAATARLEEVRRQLAGFGQVNLLALKEAEELQQRHDFLREQEADLLASIRTVRDAIAKMEKSSREKFLATFFQVGDHFSRLFAELFGGGRASLRLTDEDNIWEAGIEIAAAPPGKRLQNLRLFSGGEKALIAIALVFAFFKVNPAPFCVLDEVDAPLDEANIGRFCQLVRKFAADSQFLLITHNQKTMTIGDYLYGITMEESGVSKAVAVELTDYSVGDGQRRTALAE